MLDVIYRSQRGRVCNYSDNGRTLSTPAVLPWGPDFDSCVYDNGAGRTVRICGKEVCVDPKFLTTPASGVKSQVMAKDGIAVLRLPVEGDEISPDDCEVVGVPNAYEVRENFRSLVDQTVKARRAAGYGRLLVMLGVADPANMALLAYMGVDAVDESFVRVAGDNGYSTTAEGIMECGMDCSPANFNHLKEEASKATAPRRSTSGGVAVKGMESISQRKMNFSPQIDVRGERLESALNIVTRFIDDATMIGISQVKILHGKGTGVLREELRKYLKTVAGVISVRDEALEMGGAGKNILLRDT